MSVEMLAQFAGVLLSLALAYVPAWAKWYDSKDAPAKARIMGGLLVVISVGIFALACARLAGDLSLGVACDRASAVELIKILLAALIANQSTFLIAVRPFRRNA